MPLAMLVVVGVVVHMLMEYLMLLPFLLLYLLMLELLVEQGVAQETLLRAWKQAPRWKPGKAKFDTWLHRVAMNLCYDRLRKRREIATDAVPEQVDDGAAPDRGLMARDVGLRVDAALQALPERQREAVVLCHYQELGNIEAAGIMGVSVEALESLLSRGRRALRSALSDLNPASEGER